MRWDNYGSLFLDVFSSEIQECVFATHDEGDAPNHRKVQKVKPWLLPENIAYWIGKSDGEWICNLDLDFFFCPSGVDNPVRMLADDYISSVGQQMQLALSAGKVRVLTVALSPESCGGWTPSEEALATFCSGLGIAGSVLQEL